MALQYGVENITKPHTLVLLQAVFGCADIEVPLYILVQSKDQCFDGITERRTEASVFSRMFMHAVLCSTNGDAE